MRRSAIHRLILVLFACVLGSLLVAPANAAASAPVAHGIRVSPIGHPTWKLVDFHLFSAPIGTAATGYAEFGQTAEALLPPPDHRPHPQLGIGPGYAHQGPYDNELAEGVAAQRYSEGVRFHTDQFSDGLGVWAVWMAVPAPGVIGSSPDFSAGPIIPNNLFPIHVLGTATHNGAPLSKIAKFDVPALVSKLTPPFDVDGASHTPFFFADNADFALSDRNLRGSYRWQFTLVDATGNGWSVAVHFTVAP
ncbi:hypothetical protein ACVBEQ_22665 [Nakamurella sp. GG22]